MKKKAPFARRAAVTTLGWLLLGLGGGVMAEESNYPSGMMRRFASDFEVPTPENEAIQKFLQTRFPFANGDFEWRVAHRFADATHKHYVYHLYYLGRRVSEQTLKLHYNRQGWVDYASSTWDFAFQISLPTDTAERREVLARQIRKEFIAAYGFAPGRLELEPVVWKNPASSEVVAAFEVQLNADRPRVVRRFVVEQASGRVLEEKKIARFTSNIYSISPYDGGSNQGPFTPVTLPSLDATTFLSSPALHVVRETYTDATATTTQKVEIQAAFDFSAGISANPAAYFPTPGFCTGSGATQCPNQGFDGVNVYYHLQSYRNAVDAYYAEMGVTQAFDADPLTIIINSLSLDLGSGQTSNNAAYISSPCTSDGTTPKCIVILKPAPATSSSCGPNQVVFYDLAREAIVIVHEYQHYITDNVTHLISGTTSYNVGDSIHEGYSDYFAASQISALNGEDVTLVGQYGFQRCPAIQRDVGVLQRYTDDASFADPHHAGLSWASGLWQLRKEFGKATADMIGYKSQFFIPANAGFVDAVEALAQADKSLNQGAHVARIRELFYDEINFIGGKSGVFRDTANAIAEVGFHSCGSVSGLSNPGLSFGVVFGWLALTLGLGRRRRRP